MINPVRVLAEQFLLKSPLKLLVIGMLLSLLDFLALYTAAAQEDTLFIDHGVGLLQNYGLFSTLLGNTVLLFAAKLYYESVCAIRQSKAVISYSPIKRSLSVLNAMIKMHRKYQFLIYLLVVIGALFWTANVGFHVLGNPEVRWGHKVFDSPDHILTFCASRIHNLYTWLIVLPLVGHIVIYTSIQLRKTIEIAAQKKALRYDVLNPDQRGGFLFVERALVAFNVIIALVYVQITLHIETFALMHVQHIIAYVSATLLLIGVNRVFLGNVYSTIKRLRMESLDNIKEKVYSDDKLSFEILKYCYERKVSVFLIVNTIIKVAAIVIPGFIKFWPNISAMLNGS